METLENKKKILVVDDDGDYLSVVEDMLKEKFEVFTNKSGREALQRLYTGFIPDLVLLDIYMPGMDGWEVYRRIKTIDYLDKLPVVFFTSINEKLTIDRAHDIAAVDYLMKPFEKEDLIARLKVLLRKHVHRAKQEDKWP